MIKCCTSCGSHNGQASCQASWNLPVAMKKRRKPVNSLLNNLINISSHKHVLWFNFVLVFFSLNISLILNEWPVIKVI